MEVDQALDPVVSKLTSWGNGLVELLPNLVVAVLVMIAAWLAARVAARITRRLADRASARGAIQNLLASLAKIIVLSLGLFVALGVLKLDKTVTSLLAGAGVVGLAIGFAAQDLAANFLSGTLISLRRPFGQGDLIETEGHFGTVERIDLRVTRLRKPTGELVLVPNRLVLESPLVNFSESGRRRVDLRLGVSYDDDLDLAKRLALEAVEGIDGRLTDRDAELFYEEFGDSSINFVVRFWVPFQRQPDLLGPRSAAIERIKTAFDANGISIPFPIRTVDFGIRGGVTLTEALDARGAAGGGDRQS